MDAETLNQIDRVRTFLNDLYCQAEVREDGSVRLDGTAFFTQLRQAQAQIDAVGQAAYREYLAS